jgi:hypothetical protein
MLLRRLIGVRVKSQGSTQTADLREMARGEKGQALSLSGVTRRENPLHQRDNLAVRHHPSERFAETQSVNRINMDVRLWFRGESMPIRRFLEGNRS